MRLLLVEDEKDLGVSIHNALTKRDYIVDWVEDGQTAWDYLNEELLSLSINAEVLLSSHIPDQSCFYIQGNESQIYRMLLNVVGNAIKYTPVGGEVKINLLANNNQGIITIQDTGIGIPAVDVPHIFDRFYRVNSDRSRNTGGSGLGLAIALAIVQTHQGKLEVESLVDQGSKFTVILPLISKINK
ncbi:ATP-binding protein [Okeanomitos corallinicola TIOX110]|uniref:histidine kinase n=1 Tax=Okeanomitos corallinicola TIOX110 TaxID=3133117 RepID=A0ABZ2UU26_9CYAN